MRTPILKTPFFASFAILVLLLGAPLGRGGEPSGGASAAVPIQQQKSDLLAGFEKGVCYSGFRHGQHPDRGAGAINPSDKEILQDLQILGQQCHVRLLRLYDSQENSEAILRLIKANKLGMKVLLGAWLDAEVSNPNCPWHKEPYPAKTLEANKLKNAREIANVIRLAKQYPDIVLAVAVGNEALVSWNDHMVPVDSVIAYVRQVKKSIAQPVTVADNYEWWTRHGSALAKEVDFISVHTYPVWEGKDIGQALSWSIANLQAVRNSLPQSRMVITEAGWATVAKEFGARASQEKQKQYYNQLYDWAGKMNITTFFFEAFDEDWKGEDNDPQGAEKHWGLFTVDRRAKKVASEPE
jgi:exo-beta-1,3-glucanase (GH17 family)